MTQAKGYRARLLLDFETTYGSDPATPAALVMPVNSIGLAADRSKNSPATLTGSRHPVIPWDGNLDVGGPLVVPVDYTAFGYWLKAMMGSPTTSGLGPYDHEFKPGNTQPSLVLEKQFQDIAKYWKYNGCKVSRWSMSLGGDEELVANLDIIGAKETPGTTAYDSSPTSVSLDRLDNFEATLEEGGSSIANVVSLDFEVDFGLDADQYVIGGSGIRGSLPEGILAVSGTLRALFEDHTLVTKALNSTESSLRIEITHGTSELDIYFPELQYARAKTPVDGPQGVQVELGFTAYYDDNSDSSVLVATLTNDQSSY